MRELTTRQPAKAPAPVATSSPSSLPIKQIKALDRDADDLMKVAKPVDKVLQCADWYPGSWREHLDVEPYPVSDMEG
jgi:hypothetical protein